MATLTWNPGINSVNPYVQLVVTESSQSISGNYTTLSYSLKLYRPSTVYSSASKSYNVKINGSIIKNGTTTIGGSGTKTIASGTVNVYHNSDGTKKNVSLSFYMDIGITWSGTATGNASASGSMNLTTIPRASSISSFPNFTIGNSFTVGISRASSSFTHKLILYAGSTYVGEWSGIGTSYTVSLNSTHQDRIYKTIPSSTSRTMTMRVYTYSGSTLIGSYKTATATAYVSSSIKPTIGSIGHSEYVSSVASKIGSYVQDLSRLNLSINSHSGAKYSTIKSYKITFNGKSYSSRTATSSTVTTPGTLTITGTITDSRGRTASKSTTVSILAYQPPKLTTFTANRSNSLGTLQEDGTYIKVTRNGTWSNLNNKNAIEIIVSTRPKGGTWSNKDTGTGTSGTINKTLTIGTYDITSSYEVRVQAKDQFNTTTSVITVGTAGVTMSLGKSGVGIGMVHGGNYTLEVGGSIEIGNGTKQDILRLYNVATNVNTASRIEFALTDGQNVQIRHNSHDIVQPPYGLHIEKTADNTQQELKAYLSVEGNLFVGEDIHVNSGTIYQGGQPIVSSIKRSTSVAGGTNTIIQNKWSRGVFLVTVASSSELPTVAIMSIWSSSQTHREYIIKTNTSDYIQWNGTDFELGSGSWYQYSIVRLV